MYEIFISGSQISGGGFPPSVGTSYNPRPSYTTESNYPWQRPSGHGIGWNQGGYYWQRPVFPNYQPTINNPSYGTNNGIIA